MTEIDRNSCVAGAVLVRFKAGPVVDGRQMPGALVTAVNATIDAETELVAEWPEGIYAECPVTLAEGLNALIDAAGHHALAEAALTRFGANREGAPVETLAAELWNAYRFGVGGTAFDGKPLPERYGDLPERQREGWRAVALTLLVFKGGENAPKFVSATMRQLRGQG